MRRSLRMSVAAAALVIAGICAPAVATGAQHVDCETLQDLQLPDTAIQVAQAVTGGSFTPPGSITLITDLPDFCRVRLVVAPQINIEMWLPLQNWNGKFQGVGIGGWAGSINFGGLAPALRRGYAAAATDTGHTGGDTSWAVGRPDLIIDYAYRSNHEMALKAKAIIRAFYGKRPSYSYFQGCSAEVARDWKKRNDSRGTTTASSAVRQQSRSRDFWPPTSGMRRPIFSIPPVTSMRASSR